jgi:glycosyltransferase involved in cell wall biosynthesis
VLPHAQRIYTISEAMKRVVCAGLPSSAHAKVKVVPLWADHSHGNELSARDLRAEWGLAGKKVLLYAGNLGITHPLKALLGLAKRLEHDDQWRLLIVGRGPQRDALEQHATDYRNVIWKDPVPSSDRPNLLALATWGGVLLDSKAGTASVPSKTYNLLAAGIPLLAIVPDDSEVAALVNDQRVGLCAAETEIEPLAAKLAAVTAAEHEAFAKQARDCSRRYDPALAESFTVACGQPEPVFAGVEVPRAT